MQVGSSKFRVAHREETEAGALIGISYLQVAISWL